jgi:hypothetical protein
MNRTAAILTALGLLAVTSGLGAAVVWRDEAERAQPLLHAKTGQPLTLEAVVRDIAWHRETFRKLRRLD